VTEQIAQIQTSYVSHVVASGKNRTMKEQEYYYQADELAALARLRQALERFERAPVFEPEHPDAQNLLTSIRWYANLPHEEKEKRVELSEGFQRVVDSLVRLLQSLKVPYAEAPTDDHFGKTRWLAAELIGHLTRANPELLLLGRPMKTYKGVPEELVALVLGMDVKEFRRYGQRLPEIAKGPWAMEVSYVIDLFARGPLSEFVAKLTEKPKLTKKDAHHALKGVKRQG